MRAQLDSVRAQLDSVRAQLHSMRAQLDSVRAQLDSVRAQLDSVRDLKDVCCVPMKQYEYKTLDNRSRLRILKLLDRERNNTHFR